MIRFVIAAIAVFQGLLYADDYSFKGKHFVASYLECDLRALCNLSGLIDAMSRAVCASGATILDEASTVFPPHGLTLVYLLSESHASLHTYPEHGSCFVDLFTCGDSCSSEPFDQILREYLQPKHVNAKLFLRAETIEEIQ